MSLIKRTLPILYSPAAITLLISLILFTINLTLTHRIRPYDSDDVSYQNIAASWRPFSGKILTLGSSDNYVDKLPIFMIFAKFFGDSRRSLLIESCLFALTGFTLFYISAMYFLRKSHVVLTYVNLLPFIWLSSFGHEFSQLYLNPAWRGFEMGLYSVTVMAVASVFFGDVRPLGSLRNKVLTLLSSIGVGILIFSDPYFIYFTLGPIVLLSVILLYKRTIRKSDFAIVIGWIVVSYLFSKATALVTYASGIRIATSYPVQFVTFDQLGNGFVQTIHSILIIFGASPFGREPMSGSAISALLDLALVTCIFVISYKTWKIRRFTEDKTKDLRHAWLVYFALVGVSVIVLYTVSTVADGTNTYRYFITLVLNGTLLTALALGSDLFALHQRNLIRGMLLLAIILNMGVAIRDTYVYPMTGVIGDSKNAINFDLIQTMHENGLTKGYANYWQSDINTYLSQDSVTFLPSYCSGSTLMKFHWLIAENQFSKHANNSFYIFDPTAPVAPTSDCSQSQIISQLGKPSKTLVIDGKTIYIFPYDISNRLL